MSGKRSRSRWFVLLILTGVGLGALLLFRWQPHAQAGDTDGDPVPNEETILYSVSLTFDDGPLAGTDDCIDVLKSENVKGTFFMVGEHMISDQRKQWVRDAHNNGNLIGNHSYIHWHESSNYDDPPVGKTNAEWLENFQNNDAKIAEVLGAPVGTKYKYSRLPGKNAWRAGDIKKDDGNSARVADHLSGNGYEIYGWDTEWNYGEDYTPIQTPQQMVDIVKNLLQNGPTMKPRKVIVLMHDPMFRTSTGYSAPRN